MTEPTPLQKIQQAIAMQESLRGVLSDEQVEATLAELRQKEATLLAQTDSGAVAQGAGATAIGQGGVHAHQAEYIITGDHNQITQIIQQIASTALSEAELRDAIGGYLTWVREQNGTIHLRGVQYKGRNVIELDLQTVYVPLAATLTAAPELRFDPRDERQQFERAETHREIPLTDVLSHGRRLIITGGPGCGKTTVLMHIAWVLAETLGRNTPRLAADKLGLPATEPLPLPIYIPINRYAKFLREHEDEDHRLDGYIATYLEKVRQTSLPSAAFAQLLQRGQHLMLLLDGLDEVPNEAERVKVTQAIEDFVTSHPSLRVIVTCRTAAYKDRVALGHNFREIQVQALAEEHIAALIRQAYTAVAPHDPIAQETLADDLLDGISRMEQERQARLGKQAERLVTSPLLVRMLLLVHLSERRLPQQRAELYDKAIRNMILPDHARDTAVREDLGNLIGDPVQQLELMQTIAFQMHQQGAEQGREIDEPDLRRILRQTPFAALTDPLIAATRQRGTLMEERLGTYRFIHLAFQEFLVARHLIDALLFEQKLDEFIQRHDCLTNSWWREPLLLLAGYLSFNYTRPAQNYLRYLAGLDNRPLGGVTLVAQWAGAELAGTALLKWPTAPSDLKAEVAQRLVTLIEQGDTPDLPPQLRAQAGRVLSQLGDSRRGVGLRVDGLPDIAWGKVVPVGRYEYVAKGFEVQKPYALAKYPVTYAQFQAFVDAEDFADERWWQGMPTGIKELYEQEYKYANHPRENVSWYQAVTFCRWLSDKRKLDIRLPHEYEWEVAARYNDGRVYPWGNEFDTNKANTDKSGIGQTTAVGIYPAGRQPQLELYDLSGNVWEWCQNKHSASAETQVDDSGDTRGLRGGSWNLNQLNARAASRNSYHPFSRVYYRGFRVVVVCPPSHLVR